MKTNFNWRVSTEQDYSIFNEWHKLAKENSEKNNMIDGYTKFLTNDKNYLLGELFQDLLIGNEFQVRNCKAALIDNNVVGAIVYSYEYQKATKITNVVINAIVVSSLFQGHGIATAMIFDMVKHKDKILDSPTKLNNVSDYLIQKRSPKLITANVNQKNFASQKAFENNNFLKLDYYNMYKFYEYRKDITTPNDKQYDENFQQQIREIISAVKCQNESTKTR